MTTYKMEISETPDERGLYSWRVINSDGSVVSRGGGPDLVRERDKAERDMAFFERHVA